MTLQTFEKLSFVFCFMHPKLWETTFVSLNLMQEGLFCCGCETHTLTCQEIGFWEAKYAQVDEILSVYSTKFLYNQSKPWLKFA